MLEEDLNVDISNIIDLINIRNLPEMISDYLHSKEEKKYSNLRKFYSTLFDYFSEDIRNSYLNRILKYLSSDTPSDIYFIDDINDGVFDNELKKFCDDLVDIINKYDDCTSLYEQLNRKVNFIFYENNNEDNFCKIKTYHNDKKYNMFIFSLFKHAFKNYKISLPGIAGKELYESTKTLKIDTSYYIRCLYAASSIGNDDASIQLYNTIVKYDVNIATSFLLKTKEDPIVLWMLGYNLENNRLNKEMIQAIREKYKYIFDIEDDFINNIHITEYGKNKFYDVTLMLACQMYYYCFNKYDYTKAGNSLGKLLIFNAIIYNDDRKESIRIGKEYLKNEMRRGNVNAITNIAIYSYRNPEDSDYTEDELKKILKTSASFGDSYGNYHLGKILYDEGKYSEALPYLEYAASKNNARSYIVLGNYNELKGNNELAIENYKKSIINGCHDGAYYLALLYYNMSNSSMYKDNSELYKALYKEYIDKHYKLFSEEIKEKADLLLK